MEYVYWMRHVVLFRSLAFLENRFEFFKRSVTGPMIEICCQGLVDQVRIQDLCKGGGQPRFCRHHAAELRRRQKFGRQNGVQGGGGMPP